MRTQEDVQSPVLRFKCERRLSEVNQTVPWLAFFKRSIMHGHLREYRRGITYSHHVRLRRGENLALSAVQKFIFLWLRNEGSPARALGSSLGCWGLSWASW